MKIANRIACIGHVRKNEGSLVGSNFIILEEMLERGYKIDYYDSNARFYPKELLKYNDF
ncbi:MAG: hypothetical protein HC930_15780 [Hydrococcus sp. SU_1_0]|nr:hypothetical protein [Hydrococcus sp. SU_1_0]